jgi:lipoprotein signal peptidase
MSLTALAVVATELAVKFSVVKVLADHTLGPLMPVTNPEFLLGVAGTVATLMVLAMLAGVVAAALLATRLIQQHKIPGWAAGLAVGGALANTVDRALHGAVQDFLLIGPIVVNLADLAVVAGLTIAGVTMLRSRPDTGTSAR